jgi:hypothetical protein
MFRLDSEGISRLVKLYFIKKGKTFDRFSPAGKKKVTKWAISATIFNEK